jgi:hypothetical protein
MEGDCQSNKGKHTNLFDEVALQPGSAWMAEPSWVEQ